VRTSPTVHAAVEFTINRQVRQLIRRTRSFGFINVNTQAGGHLQHETVFKGVGVRENPVGFRRMLPVLLNAEIVNPKVENGAPPYRPYSNQLRREHRSGPDRAQRSFSGARSRGMDNRGANEINQLLRN
jgi:hypothetical protein